MCQQCHVDFWLELSTHRTTTIGHKPSPANDGILSTQLDVNSGL